MGFLGEKAQILHAWKIQVYEAFKVPIRVGELFGYTERRIRYDSLNVT